MLTLPDRSTPRHPATLEELAKATLAAAQRESHAPRLVERWRGHASVRLQFDSDEHTLSDYLLGRAGAVGDLIGSPYTFTDLLEAMVEAHAQDPAMAWVAATWIYDTLWHGIRGGARTEYAPDLPRLAGYRFCIAEQPWTGPEAVTWTTAALRGRSPRRLAYGDGATGPVDLEGIERRREWVEHLARWQDIPDLQALPAPVLEGLITRTVLRPGRGLVHYVLDRRPGGGPAPSPAVQSGTWQVAERVIEEHYLPRYMIGETAQLVKTFQTECSPAEGPDALWLSRLRTAQRQYRWPATAAFGAGLLLQAGSWYHTQWWVALLVTAVLTTGCLLYLRGQLVSIGIARADAWRRARGEFVVGAAWAAAVTALTCLALLPTFGSSFGDDYAGASYLDQMGAFLGWTHPSWQGLAGGIVRFAMATAWCTATGVFLQALWQSESISSPLYARRWTGSRG